MNILWTATARSMWLQRCEVRGQLRQHMMGLVMHVSWVLSVMSHAELGTARRTWQHEHGAQKIGQRMSPIQPSKPRGETPFFRRTLWRARMTTQIEHKHVGMQWLMHASFFFPFVECANSLLI